MKNNYCVYIHILPNGKVYIGITNKKPEERWHNGRGYNKNKAFFSAIIYYGWANIKHEILYKNLSEEEASQKEAELIKKFHADEIEYGFNVQTGGVRGFTHNEEARKKIAETSRLHWQDPEYRKKVHDSQVIAQSKEEVKKKKSECAKERYHNDKEYREKLIESARLRMNDPIIKEEYRRRSKKMWESLEFRKQWAEKMGGANNPTARAVDQYTLDGLFIKRYSTCKEGAEATGTIRSGVTACAKGKQKSAGGYIWRYADGNESEV